MSDDVFDMYVRFAHDVLSNQFDPIPFFRFVTVAALHIFLLEKVDVAILEVGIGGRYDCTNILPSPVACGVTTISLEHTDLLGNSLEDISWHKFGIFKPVHTSGFILFVGFCCFHHGPVTKPFHH